MRRGRVSLLSFGVVGIRLKPAAESWVLVGGGSVSCSWQRALVIRSAGWVLQDVLQVVRRQ